MNDDLLGLVAQGLDDDVAANVALDALEEDGWEDWRIYGVAYDVGFPPRRLHCPMLGEIPPWRVTPRDRLRACAAVIIFGDWPQKWPLADACWENDEYEVGHGTWLGVNRSEDPTRLAGLKADRRPPNLLRDLWDRETSGRYPLIVSPATAEEIERYGRTGLKESDDRR